MTKTAATFTKDPQYAVWVCQPVTRLTIHYSPTVWAGKAVEQFNLSDGDVFMSTHRTLRGAQQAARRIAKEYLDEAARG